MKIVEATFQIVTPMFLGGADHSATRIRESSIKGALAFWWRALHYSDLVGNSAGANRAEKLEKALKDLQQREQELFGGGKKGQGNFLLRVIDPPKKSLHNKGDILRNGSDVVGEGTRYLGYGLMGTFGDSAGRLVRSCFQAGDSFAIELVFRKSVDPQDIVEILRALKLFGLLGGLGSRVRRGWGSVALKSLQLEGIDNEESWTRLVNQDTYKTALTSVIRGLPTRHGSDYSLTAFAAETDIRIGTNADNNALNVLNKVGNGLQRYRGWRGLGERNFRTDHDWFKQWNARPLTGNFTDTMGRSIAAKRLPERAAFGIPHNYFSHDDGDMRMDVEGPAEQKDRRASPLMIHIHTLENGDAFGVLSYFPNSFLEPATIRINSSQKEFVFDRSVISHFLKNETPTGGGPANGAYFPSEPLFP